MAAIDRRSPLLPRRRRGGGGGGGGDPGLKRFFCSFGPTFTSNNVCLRREKKFSILFLWGKSTHGRRKYSHDLCFVPERVRIISCSFFRGNGWGGGGLFILRNFLRNHRERRKNKSSCLRDTNRGRLTLYARLYWIVRKTRKTRTDKVRRPAARNWKIFSKTLSKRPKSPILSDLRFWPFLTSKWPQELIFDLIRPHNLWVTKMVNFVKNMSEQSLDRKFAI